jgi:hypothetical protein
MPLRGNRDGAVLARIASTGEWRIHRGGQMATMEATE